MRDLDWLQALAADIQDAGGIITADDLRVAQPTIGPALQFSKGQIY